MTNFLDDTYFHFDEPVGRGLYDLLVSTYFYVDQIQKKVRPVGISPDVDFSGSAADVWISVLDTAALKGKLRVLLAEIAKTDPTVGTRIDELLADTPVLPPAPPSGAPAALDAMTEDGVLRGDTTLTLPANHAAVLAMPPLGG